LSQARRKNLILGGGVSQGDREGEEKGLGARRKWMGTRGAWLLKRAVSVMGFLPPLQYFSFIKTSTVALANARESL
jgi:hypothetical protein